MTEILLAHGAPARSPDLRHEVGLGIGDPITFLEIDGRRIVAAGAFEEPLLAQRDDVVDEVWTHTELGIESILRDSSIPEHLIDPELVRRTVARAGADRVLVPPGLPVAVADHLRAGGIEVVVEADGWAARRRRKSPWELEGIERAQRATEIAMLTAARMLRGAEPTPDGGLRFEGEILTAELVREAMTAQLGAQGADCEEIIVHSGDAWADGHLPGSGRLRAGATCIIDCFPRERRSGAHTDMTRTFVPGEPGDEVRRLHAHCKAAVEIALEHIRPGRADAFERVCDYFESNGFPTVASWTGPGRLTEGFLHELGHGVGLEVHERPYLGRRSEPLVAGDVVAIEPGLYFPGVGGVRLEDTVLVVDDGFELLSDPFPYDLQP